MGSNLMDPRRRAAVLVTSLRTSPSALRRGGGGLRPGAAARLREAAR
jgi:hypothetical protein